MRTFLMIWVTWCHLWVTASAGVDDCRQLKYSLRPIVGKALENHVVLTLNITREDVCQIRCFLEPSCMSYNVGPLENNDKYLCEISDSNDVVHPEDLNPRSGFIYRGTKSPCNSSPCVKNSTCQAGYTSEGYRCVCPTGFTGLFCNQDVNECTSGGHDCHVNADCINTVGSFNCTCNLGFIGDGHECTDINECTNGSHDCHALADCVNTAGSFNCICHPGYTGIGQVCTDDDECTSGGHDCDVNAVCKNTVGSFNCTCGLGFTGDGRTCTAINDCSETPQTTGVYHIVNHGVDPFPVYCDQTSDGGGWTMVFKVVGGADPETVGQLWQTSEAHSENVIEALDITTTFFGQYKNRIVMDWQTFQPQEARVALYENGVEVVSLKFNAAGSDNWNWFTQANIISSPWTDLKTFSGVNVGIISPSFADRYFEISGPYLGCAGDTGWIIVTHHPICAWDTRSSHPSIHYSKLATKAVLNEFANVGVADVLAVYIR